MPVLLIGAAARDTVMQLVHDIEPTRATSDSDFAVRVSGWEQYAQLGEALVVRGGFKSTRVPHRYKHPNGRLIDLVPFGEVEDTGHRIQWPGTGGTMNVQGFEDALRAACLLRITSSPEVLVRATTPAGLVVLKLISWNERYPERDNDAADVWFIMKNYVDCGNLQHLYDRNPDIIEDPDFDFVTASARLLGRHMADVMSSETRQSVSAILTAECSEGEAGRLVMQMRTGTISMDSPEERARALAMLRRGVEEALGR